MIRFSFSLLLILLVTRNVPVQCAPTSHDPKNHPKLLLLPEGILILLISRRLIWAKCINLGQTCVAPDYVLCSESVQKILVPKVRRIGFPSVCIPISLSFTIILSLPLSSFTLSPLLLSDSLLLSHQD